MPYKDPAKMAEYMRKMRAAKKVNVNPVNPVNPSVNRKPVNLRSKISQVSGFYEDGYWVGICPVCTRYNKMDPKRSYRPVDKCDHFQQLKSPGEPSVFLFKRVNVNPVNHERKPVNPVIQRYLLSYSRKKYQFVLYQFDEKGQRSLVRSYPKGSKLSFPGAEIELTWGPEEIITGNDEEEATR